MKSLRTLTNRPAKLCVTLLALGALTAGVQQASAAAQTWNNIGTDYNTAANWTTTTPGTGDVGKFTVSPTFQPNLSISLSNAGIYFAGTGIFGYDLTASPGASFTLTGYGSTGSNGTSNTNAAAVRSEATSGTNTIDANITIAPASNSTSVFYQAAGGTLDLNGIISGASTIDASFKGAGTIQLNGANTFAVGTIDQANTTIVVGNDGGLGTGLFSVNNTATLQAGGGARTVATDIALAATTTVSGSNAFTFNGSVTGAGAATRTLTVNNTGGVVLGGNVFLQDPISTGHTLVINGSSAVAINGVVQDGGTGPASLKYTGSSTLTLSNTNTYSGGTLETIAGSTIVANHDGALGTGNISLTAGNVTLTMQNGATNQYTGIGAAFSLVMADIVNLNYTGANVVGSLIVDGVALAPGLYGAGAGAVSNPDMAFFGNGYLLVAIPEPSVYMLLGVGLLICGQRFFRRRRVS